MSEVHICNGCGKVVTDDVKPSATDAFHEVMAVRATLAGVGRGFGLASDARIVGELCDLCWDAVMAFIAPNDAEAREAAREIVAAPRRLVAASA